MRSQFPLRLCLQVLGFSSSSYYFQHQRKTPFAKYEHLFTPLRALAEQSHYTYGSHRLWLGLRRHGITVSEKVVRKLMRHLNIHSRYGNARLHRYNSYIGEITPVPANLANRNFHSDKPYTLLVTDVSEFHTRQGKIYFSPLIDCYDGTIVSSAIAQQPNQQLTLTMLTRFSPFYLKTTLT